LDDEFLEHVSDAVAEAMAILIAGPDSAKSELAAHLTRQHPEVAARIVSVETIDHPSDGALVAVARLYFNTKDNSRSQISRTDLGS
jgi:stalled ribosome rescue protein Dom34